VCCRELQHIFKFATLFLLQLTATHWCLTYLPRRLCSVCCSELQWIATLFDSQLSFPATHCNTQSDGNESAAKTLFRVNCNTLWLATLFCCNTLQHIEWRKRTLDLCCELECITSHAFCQESLYSCHHVLGMRANYRVLLLFIYICTTVYSSTCAWSETHHTCRHVMWMRATTVYYPTSIYICITMYSSTCALSETLVMSCECARTTVYDSVFIYMCNTVCSSTCVLSETHHTCRHVMRMRRTAGYNCVFMHGILQCIHPHVLGQGPRHTCRHVMWMRANYSVILYLHLHMYHSVFIHMRFVRDTSHMSSRHVNARQLPCITLYSFTYVLLCIHPHVLCQRHITHVVMSCECQLQCITLYSFTCVILCIHPHAFCQRHITHVVTSCEHGQLQCIIVYSFTYGARTCLHPCVTTWYYA